MSKFLEVFVRESNLIENIKDAPGTPLYDNHYRVAKLISQRNQISSKEIHAELFRNIIEANHCRGEYRTVDSQILPNPNDIPKLMYWWEKECEKYYKKDSPSLKETTEKAYLLHIQFLCIHPFEDGNGRIARLLLNMFRVQKRLSWHTIYNRDKIKYYDEIRDIEKTSPIGQHINLHT